MLVFKKVNLIYKKIQEVFMLEEKLIYSLVLLFLLLFSGTIFYNKTEGWSYTDSYYFSTMTLTTIGYGDFAPTKPITKMFTSIYALIGVAVMLFLLSTIVTGYLMKQEKYFERIIHKIIHKGEETEKRDYKPRRQKK